MTDAPRWHDKPTGPGTWVCAPDHAKWFLRTEAVQLSEADLERGAPFFTKAAYGPIPELPEEKNDD